MEALLASFLESLTASAPAMSEAVASGGMAPPSAMEGLGSALGGMANKAASPYVEAYNTFQNPESTAKDYLSSAYKLSFGNKDEEQIKSPMAQSYGGYSPSYMGGIPSLLQNSGTASQGILPYIGSR